MQLFQRLCATLAMLTALVAMSAAAAPKDAVFNKAGVWGIDVDHGSCAASMTLKDGATFLLRGTAGQVDLAYFARHKLPVGKTARIETEAHGFDFAPGYTDGDDGIYTADHLSARDVAALRLAGRLRVLADDKLVVAITLDGTGFEEALDGLIDCSNGRAGWWGKGVQVAEAEPAPAPEPVLNKEGLWSLSVLDGGTGCGAVANIDEHTRLMLLAAAGRVGLAVQSDAPLPQGKKGRVETGAYKFDFVPGYGGSRYFASEQPFDSQALFALRRAGGVRVSVDGKLVLEASFEGSGLPELITSLIDCSKGEKGWWGAGAPQS